MIVGGYVNGHVGISREDSRWLGSERRIRKGKLQHILRFRLIYHSLLPSSRREQTSKLLTRVGGRESQIDFLGSNA